MIRRYSGLLAVTLVGLILRLANINDWPLWSDEALTLLIAQWPLQTLFLVPADPTPGLYYALHKGLLGPFAQVSTARSISVAAGTLLIPASYFLAKQARVPALLTAALVALSFVLIDYSQEARAYSLLGLLVTLSAGLFLWWARTERLGLLMASLGFALAAFYTHFSAIFWLGPLALAAIWTGKRRAVSPLLAMAILAVPELSRLAQYHQPGFAWLLQASPTQAANTFARAVLPFRLSGGVALAVALLIGWRMWVHRGALASWVNANRSAAIVLMIFLTIPLAAWLFGFALRPIFMPRTILLGVPGILLALGLLLRFEHLLVRAAVIALYAVSLLATGTTRPREDWRGVARRVGTDTVLMCQSWQAAAMKHALGRESRVLLVYGDSLLEIDGVPWQLAYFNALTNDEAKRRALRQGQAVPGSLHPVWAVRTGSTSTLAANPTTLDQAIRICSANRADGAPRYQID